MKISPSVKILTVAMSIIAALTGWTSIAINRTISLSAQARPPTAHFNAGDVVLLQHNPNTVRPIPIAITHSSH